MTHPSDMDPERANAIEREGLSLEKKEEMQIALSDGWIELDGKQIQPLDGEAYNFDAAARGEVQPGTCAEHGGTIVAIDGDGHTWVSRSSKRRRAKLARAGFQSDPALSVPMTQGERFVDAGDRQQMRAIELDSTYERMAEKTGITETADRWLNVDRLTVKKSGGAEQEIPDRYDADESKIRVEQVGTYRVDDETKTIVRVDGTGTLQMAPYSPERVATLETAGYRAADSGEAPAQARDSLESPMEYGDYFADEDAEYVWSKLVEAEKSRTGGDADEEPSEQAANYF